MAGTASDRELMVRQGSRVHFETATQSDDAEIRRLLREAPMEGEISLSLEREPDYFSESRWMGNRMQTVIAREGQRVVCVGDCSVRARYVNGKICSVGYLCGLRLDRSAAGRFDILRRGYDFFREIEIDAPADFYFTSIASENRRARKFLERGFSGMPIYEFVCEYVSVLLPIPRRLPPISKSDFTSMAGCCSFINEHNSGYQLASCWSPEEMKGLEMLGLSNADFWAKKVGRVVVAGAVWDQRAFKQTVIRGYSRRLSWIRPAINLMAAGSGRPGLPEVGTPLSHAFVSFLAADANDPEQIGILMNSLFAIAAAKGCQFVTVGFPASDSRLEIFRTRYRGREYRSRIHIVRWPDMGRPASDLDGRPVWPEVSLL